MFVENVFFVDLDFVNLLQVLNEVVYVIHFKEFFYHIRRLDVSYGIYVVFHCRFVFAFLILRVSVQFSDFRYQLRV